MKTKTVLRYYCDHCSKGYFKKPSAFRHEATCCHNPKRVCGLCDCSVIDFTALTKIAIEKSEVHESPIGGQDYYSIKDRAVIGQLYSLVDGCPACLLAVLVQAKVYAFDVFNYKDELSEWHREQNQPFSSMLGIH